MNSKQKGKRGELEFAQFCREHGFPEARRSVQYCGNTGEAADIVGVDGIHIEVKRAEQVKDEVWLQQAERDARKGQIPTVNYRRSREEWKTTMRTKVWLMVLEELTDLQKYRIAEKLKFSVKSEKNGNQP